MLREMTDEEWQGWLWYMGQEPFGAPVEDVQHGMLCAAVLAPHMKKGERADPRNYMVRPPDDPQMSPEQTEAMLDVLLGVRAS